MGFKLKNIKQLFRNTRTRTIILLTGIILLFGLLIGIKHFTGKTASVVDSSIQLKDFPNLKSVPGGVEKSPSADYQRLQAQQNLQQAALAEKTGRSAIPTLLNSSDFDQIQGQGFKNNSCCSPCPCNTCAQGQANPSLLNKVGSGYSENALPLQPSQLRSGTLVYDKSGKVVGRLGLDGKVRDSNGRVVGQVGPDGLVWANDGTVLGSTAVPAEGDPVYDATGRLIGKVGKDGKVRDAKGRILGTIGSDGIAHDLKGAVIGKIGSMSKAVPGATVYDAQGHVIGKVDADGKVRDAAGKVIGEVGPDGIARDADGKPIGKVGASTAGATVYDAQGHVIGKVDADGKVRDAAGKVIGEVGPDGIVRDADGNVIGHANLKNTNATDVIGTPVYDAQGRLVGSLGPGGRVYNAKGDVIGHLASNGLAYDTQGKVLGRTGMTIPGTPIYDKQGHLIGTVGSDGIVRGVQGKVLATLGSDGVARDLAGNPIGSTTPPQSSSIATSSHTSNPDTTSSSQAAVSLLPSASGDSSNPELQAILNRQAQQISAQKAEQLQQQMQATMGTQANQLFAAWTSSTQQYVAGIPTLLTGQGEVGGTAFASAASSFAGAPVAVKAGTIMHAILLTAINSDEPGPVEAKIVDGKFKGALLLGSLTNQGQKVLLSFNILNLPKLPQSISINAVGVDENTSRTAFSSYTNNHYWLRYGTLFASAFIQGYGQSFLGVSSPYAGAVVINSGAQYPQLNLSPKSRVFVGLGQVGVQYASVLGNVFNTPPTIHVNAGTAMGVLFLSDLAAIPTD